MVYFVGFDLKIINQKGHGISTLREDASRLRALLSCGCGLRDGFSVILGFFVVDSTQVVISLRG